MEFLYELNSNCIEFGVNMDESYIFGKSNLGFEGLLAGE